MDILIKQLQQYQIISEVGTLPTHINEPHLIRYQTKIPGFRDEYHQFYGIGHSFLSSDEALLTSVGEAVERYCFLHYIPTKKDMIMSSYRKIHGTAIDPLVIAGVHKDARENSQKVRLQTFDHSSKFTWVRAKNFQTDNDVWLPLQLVTASQHLNYFFDKNREPIIRGSTSTGAAFGFEKEGALYRGFCEVIERDSFMVAYLKQITPPKISIDGLNNKEFLHIKKIFAQHELDLTLLHLPTDFSVHVVMAHIRHKKNKKPYFSIGFKADLNIATACYGAVKEALNARIAFKFLLEKIDNIAETASLCGIEPESRRVYERLNDWITRPDFARHIQFFLDGELKSLDQFKTFGNIADNQFSKKMTFLKKEFLEKNCLAFYIENTTTDLCAVFNGQHKRPRSFFAIMPELQPLYLNEDLPCFSNRLVTLPKKLGYDVDPHFTHPIPHPIP